MIIAYSLGTTKKMDLPTNVFVGIVGAVTGGLALRMAGLRLTFEYTNVSLITAVIGAVMLLAVVRATRNTMQ
jgi:uncharacterized membrane protein YeaQ/YmgE (transglycosylase-associated protein family)